MNRTSKLGVVILIILGLLACGWLGYRLFSTFTDTDPSGASSGHSGSGGIFSSGGADASFETVTYTASGNFDSIYIENADCDVRFELEEGAGGVSVDCPECDGVTHSVEITGGRLEIRRIVDLNVFQKLNIVWGEEEMVVRLPEASYDSLELHGSSGNVALSDIFSFSDADISCSSGSISCEASVSGEADLKASSGSIGVSGLDCRSLDINTSSGNIYIDDCEVNELDAECSSGGVTVNNLQAFEVEVNSSSGDIRLENCIAASIELESSSGSIILNACDSSNISVSASSGDVFASLLSGKEFSCRTGSGDLSVPDSVSGSGRCSITTTSGDIKVTIDR